MEQTERSFEILLVEDSPTDVLMTRQALRSTQGGYHLNVVANGDDALAFLRKEAPFESAPGIDLVLLDLNLPCRNGFEVLREIKQSPQMKQIPVVILTTSQSHEDIERAYSEYANSFITKALNFTSFRAALRSLEEFWLVTATLPGSASKGQGAG